MSATPYKSTHHARAAPLSEASSVNLEMLCLSKRGRKHFCLERRNPSTLSQLQQELDKAVAIS